MLDVVACCRVVAVLLPMKVRQRRSSRPWQMNRTGIATVRAERAIVSQEFNKTDHTPAFILFQ
jgi:hypothetical protein